jgi:hypothetical protein
MIRQPRNNTAITWNARFATNMNAQMKKAQEKIDSEVLRLTAPFVPLKTGNLQRSGIRNTVLGSGKVTYKTPYSRKLYYSTTFKFRGAPQRGALWFERMKKKNKNIILIKAKEVFERG